MVTSNLARREYVHHEADAIARHIKSIVEDANRNIVITAKSSAQNGLPAEFGDITILLRGMTDVNIYEEALARHGVPALVAGGGRGYYARDEVQDLLSVLTLLDSPLDDIALLTALRSPFVGANIDTICRLGLAARGASGGVDRERGPLYPSLERLAVMPELPVEERDKIIPFLSAIEALSIDVGRISTGHLIERLIVTTNYDMRLVCRPGGRRKLANVRKLVQIALEDPGISVRDFVSRMNDLKVMSDREGDAPIAEEGVDAVRLMTIHSAKGLEFPVVILPDLSRGLVAPEAGLFTCDTAARAIGTRMCGEPDATYVAIAKRRQDDDREEYLRLLYVAMTRACEHLILCGNVGRNRGFNWADVVFPALGITTAPAAAERRTLKGGVEAMVTPMLAQPADPEGGMPQLTNGSEGETIDQLVERLLRTTQ
jgi:ATP-dependent helicase/nuclease subunit A